MSQLDHSKIIDKLGGPSVLAKTFGISSQAVSKWRKDGIPDARLMYLRLVNPEAFKQKRGSDHEKTA